MVNVAPVAGLGVRTLEAPPIEPVAVVIPIWPLRVVPGVLKSGTVPLSTPLVMVTLVASRPDVLGEALLLICAGPAPGFV